MEGTAPMHERHQGHGTCAVLHEEGLGASQSARNLHASGLDEDIAWCARESMLDVVPRFSRMVASAAEVTL